MSRVNTGESFVSPACCSVIKLIIQFLKENGLLQTLRALQVKPGRFIQH
jgi:hypothetical protein